MSEGHLRCVGSSLFLKKAYGVGYQLTIEKLKGEIKVDVDGDDDDTKGATMEDNDGVLLEIVKSAVPEARLLSNVGSAMSLQLPMGAAPNFGPMFEGLDGEVDRGAIGSYGVSITTLDEVFLLVARGEEKERKSFASSRLFSEEMLMDDDVKTARSRMDLENEGLFFRHIGALFKKRAAFFRRDKKAWCCTTLVPTLMVLLGFILFKVLAPKRDLSPVTLDLSTYNPKTSNPRNPITFNDPVNPFLCQPGLCSYVSSDSNFCGYQARLYGSENCTITESSSLIASITEAGATGEAVSAASIEEVRTRCLCHVVALIEMFLTYLLVSTGITTSS
jgi:hypothetical protein